MYRRMNFERNSALRARSSTRGATIEIGRLPSVRCARFRRARELNAAARTAVRGGEQRARGRALVSLTLADEGQLNAISAGGF